MVVLHVAGSPVCEVLVADTYLRRLRGMLLRRHLPEALLLVPGGSVHGLGMTVSLDVALLRPVPGKTQGRSVTGEFEVVKVRVLRPFGLVGGAKGVTSVLEAPVGSFATWGLGQGSVVRLTASDAPPPRTEPPV